MPGMSFREILTQTLDEPKEPDDTQADQKRSISKCGIKPPSWRGRLDNCQLDGADGKCQPLVFNPLPRRDCTKAHDSHGNANKKNAPAYHRSNPTFAKL